MKIISLSAIAGALIGAFLNKVLPELLLTVLLVILLSFTAWNTLKKAIKMYRKETQLLRESELTRMVHEQDETEAEEAGDVLLDNMDQPEDDNGEEGEKTEPAPESFEQKEALLAEQRRKEELAKIIEEERHTPQGNLKILVTLFVVVLTINLLKGGGAFPSPLGIRCGSNGFWMSNVAMLGWIVIISLMCRNYLVQRCDLKERCGYKYVEGDIKWDRRATWVYPSICCFAGFFAGMFGGTSIVLMQREVDHLGAARFLTLFFSAFVSQSAVVLSRDLSCWYVYSHFVLGAGVAFPIFNTSQLLLFVGNECASRRGLGVVSLHDSIYLLHGYHVFCCVWFARP